MEKYFIVIESSTLALKYNVRDRKMVIGGYIKVRRLIDSVVTEYFGKPLSRVIYTQTNKMRYNIIISKEDFDAGILRLTDSGFTVQSTNNLGRVMR